jgi:hypothetical protein
MIDELWITFILTGSSAQVEAQRSEPPWRLGQVPQSEAGVPARTVREYYAVLQDNLLGELVLSLKHGWNRWKTRALSAAGSSSVLRPDPVPSTALKYFPCGTSP